MAHIEGRLETFLDRFELAWMALGFVYLGIYAYGVIAQPGEDTLAVLEAINLLIYGIFAVELVLRAIATRKTLKSLAGVFAFVKKYWLSIFAVILPAFRTLRVLRVVIVIRALEPFLVKRTHKLTVVTLVTIPLLLFTSAVSVLEAEQNAEGANIVTFGDAMWWALASVTTVGYGDRFPVTDEGRLIATFLMIVGIGLFGALTALLAAWVLNEEKSEVAGK
ncbi:MAG: ion channel [Aquiluna sp.]|jgi:voltage-gated potassium channel